MAHVFLSYSSKDADLMRRLSADLRAEDLTVWTDEGLAPGTPEWEDAIEREIELAGCLVVMLSPDAKQSLWVGREIGYAEDFGKRIFPILVRGDRRNAVPLSLNRTQRVDARQDYAGAVQDLVSAVCAYLGVESRTQREQREEAEHRQRKAEEDRREAIALPSDLPPTDETHGRTIKPVIWIGAVLGGIALLASLLVIPNIWQPSLTPEEVSPETEAVSVPELTEEPEAESPQIVTTPEVEPTPPDIITIRSPVEIELVRVPAGEFLMGPDDPLISDYPQHSVYVDEFYISRHEVTNAQYAKFVVASRRYPGHWPGGDIPLGLENHPVAYVSWYDAVAFTRWLSDLTGQMIRLPTEAEWEKAARGTDGRVYPWGYEWDPSLLNSYDGGPDTSTPVGQYSPDGDSPYGLADMAGNAWEWTLSLYVPYPYDADDGRNDPESEGARVLRGGSWRTGEGHAVTYFRRGDSPDSLDYSGGYGFRVVLEPPVTGGAASAEAIESVGYKLIEMQGE